MSRRNLLVLLLATVLSYACYLRGEALYARYAAEGLASIRQYSLDSVPDSELFDGAMRGMVGVLRERGDAHSQFRTEAEANLLRSEIHQQFGGIGVRIDFNGKPPRLVVTAPPDTGSPAARAKLRLGDHILAIDDFPTDGLSIGEVQYRVRGEPNTKVRFTIVRAPEPKPFSVELVREIIRIESVLGDRRADDGSWQFQLHDDPRIAHVRITSFGDRTTSEFANVMQNLGIQGAQAIVLDLRDNPGGSLDAAVAVCEMLLPAGKTIVETRGRGQALLRRYATTADGKYVDLPVAVIVNQNSASAAEIVAACLQDQGRAVVVGQRTFGKGTVQQLLPLESGKSLLKLTWASFSRPSGANIHRTAGAPDDAKWGVLPDARFESKLSQDEFKSYRAYRDNRDVLAALRQMSNGEQNATKAAEFVDKPLQMAVRYLAGKLGDKR